MKRNKEQQRDLEMSNIAETNINRHTNVHGSFVLIVSSWKIAKYPSIDEWLNKLQCIGVLLNNKKKQSVNTYNSLAETMMNEK